MVDEKDKPKEPEETKEPDKPKSVVEEFREIRDDIKLEREKTEKANEVKAKLQSEELLSGSAGGHVEPKKVSPEDAKTEAAAEYFKGTQLEKDIRKANE